MEREDCRTGVVYPAGAGGIHSGNRGKAGSSSFDFQSGTGKTGRRAEKFLKEAKKTIVDMKAKIESLGAGLTAVKEELAQYKSIRGQLRIADLEQENDHLRKIIRAYKDVIS